MNYEEKDYHDLADLLPGIVFELDSNGIINYVSGRVTELLGYSRDELIGESIIDFLKGSEKENAKRGILKILTGKKYSEKNYHFRKKDSGYLSFFINAGQISNNGSVVGIRGIAFDRSNIRKTEKALEESEALFHVIAEQTAAGILIIQSGKILFINNYLANLFGYTINEIINTDWANLLEHVCEEDKDKMSGPVVDLNNGNDVLSNYQLCIINAKEEKKWIDVWSKIVDFKGKDSIFSVCIDITDKKIAEKALIENEERFRSMIEHSSEIIAVIDQKGFMKYQSKSLKQILGYSLGETIGLNGLELIHPDDRENVLLELKKADEEKKEFSNLDFRIMHKDGAWHNAEAAVTDMRSNPAINGFVVNLRDVTDRKIAEEKANYFKFYDSLTNLPKREMLYTRIDEEIKKAQTYRRKNEKDEYNFAIMCLGLDKFKNINDMYGPAIGDNVLQKVGSKLQKSFRDNDLVSRYIGDSYMILFSGINKYDSIVEIIQKTYNVFADPFIVEDNIFRITCSIGVCLYPYDGTDKEQLIKNSEAAMYKAKEQGRNTHRLYNAGMNAEMMNRLTMEKELEHAIFHNHFKAYYQPIYDMHNEIIGMESLIRWFFKGSGKIINPASFIPIAEKNGMIIEIGNIIFYHTCMQAKKWQEKGYSPAVLAVNISPSQFKQQKFIPHIADVLDQTGFDPRYLELEITESGIMENEKYNIKKLNELHKLGVKICIDDFGTGYSSLSKLKDYPIDTLKIDKSFIENCTIDEKSSTITRTIIDLAHNLGFKVIAEGVETKEQYDFIFTYNCDAFQGYYYSKPLPAEEFEEKLKNFKQKGD